jgi:hypothetical protein
MYPIELNLLLIEKMEYPDEPYEGRRVPIYRAGVYCLKVGRKEGRKSARRVVCETMFNGKVELES